MTNNNEVSKQFRRLIWATAICYILLVMIIIGLTLLFIHTTQVNHKLAKQGAEAHHADCILRSDFEKRIAASNAFLLTHPNGFGDIPASTIRVSIANEQKTVDALASINCGKP